MTVAAIQASDGSSIRNFVDLHAVEQGDNVCFIDTETGTEISFADCRSRILHLVARLQDTGLKPGDRVAYAFSNSADGALVILALLYGGYLATAVNMVSGEETIGYVLSHSEAKLVIADHAGARLVRSAVGKNSVDVEILSLGDLMGEPCSATPALSNFPASCDGLLMYTSGTTGRPKGVVHTHESLLWGGRNTAGAHGLEPDDRGLCVLPLYHINAFCVSLMGALVSGSSLVIPPKFSVSSFWKMIQKHKCTWFSVVPTQVSYLLHNADNLDGDALGLGKLRFGRSASAPLSPEMHEAFERKFGVPMIETMGLTETAAQILSNPMPPGVRKIGSPGIPFGNEVMIADEKQTAVTEGEEGEILVRGPNVLRCYLKNEAATREAITADGWLRTGDLGKIDQDGYVFVTGRLKELIIKGGENIAPREVDEALYGHPDVIEAAAFGVSCKDYGQRVEAGVKLRAKSNATTQDLLTLCQERLGDFKAPDRIAILPELPKGPSGKIQRMKLAELVSKFDEA
ncbi:MAG: AMP-binding protein [Pseudomonadota bacterium]